MLLLAAFVAAIASPASAQGIDWGKPPPDKALLAVVLPASKSFEISDKNSFAELIAAQAGRTLVKSYTVNPGTYTFLVPGTAGAIQVNAPAGSVQVVEYNSDKDVVFAEDFAKAADALKAGGAESWTWLGQQTFDPQENVIIISEKPGTDDPGPMKPKD